MRRRAALSVAILILVLAVAWLLITSRGAAPPSDLSELGPAAIELGATVYSENCASCHGLDLAGEPGLNWRQRHARLRA